MSNTIRIDEGLIYSINPRSFEFNEIEKRTQSCRKNIKRINKLRRKERRKKRLCGGILLSQNTIENRGY